MDQIRRVLADIQKQLGHLNPSQKLLIGALAVVLLMSLFLVSQYAGSPKLVAVIPSGTPEDQQKVAEHLDNAGIAHEVQGGKVMVVADRHFPVLAALQKAQALPADKTLLMDDLADKQSWTMSKSQIDDLRTSAVCNTIAKIVRNFPGITDAHVMISNPPSTGLGQAFRKPAAFVTVFPRPGTVLDQGTVDALADLVGGSTAGLRVADVAIIDGWNKRRYRATAPDDYFATTYLEQAAKVEERVQGKITEHLSRYIPDVIVSVNAIVDATRREQKTDSMLPRNEGTLSLPTRESTTTLSSTNASAAASPGVMPNVGMDIEFAGAGGSGGGTTTNNETSETDIENHVGRKSVLEREAPGRPTRINVAVSVPMDFIGRIVATRKTGAAAGGGAAAPAAEPTEDEIRAIWEGGQRKAIEDMVRPLIETEGVAIAGGAAVGGVQTVAGTVVVSLIPVAMSAASTGGRGGGGGGAAGFGGSSLGGGGIASLVQGSGGVVRQVFLGGLAVFAVGLMLMMVRKAGRAGTMPTAEELVGIPPALHADNDLVGEADESETAMTGIEIDGESLRTGKMLEEVSDLVKSNPSAAASVFNRWLTTES